MLPSVAGRSSVKKRFPSGSPSRAAEDAKMWMEWKKQLTAYVAWVNSQLKKKLGAHLVEDLRHDVRDGVALIDLIEVIAGEKLPNTHSAPSTTAEMMENVDAVLQFMALNKVKMHHITTRDVVDGNLKAIMRLVLALAAHYKPNSVRHSAQRPPTTMANHSITGIAQGAAAALTEARRNVTRAGHRHRRRRHREEPRQQEPQGSDSDAPTAQPVSSGPGSGHRKSASMSRISPQQFQHHPPPRQHRHSYTSNLRVVGEGECGRDRAQLDGASASSSPASSRGTSPRTSLYLSDPPSSMEGLLYNAMNHKSGLMMTSCESDTLGDSGFSDICDNLKDTHQLLFRLQELLLSGDGQDASGASPGEMEGSNPHETISILRGRLLHAEEISGSLRAELAKVKKDCLELQGEKAGLQQRLSQQDAGLAEVKVALVNLELQHSQQTAELEGVRRTLGEREQTLADLRASCLKQAQDRDAALAQLRGELLARDLQLSQLRDQAGASSTSPGVEDQVRGLMADLAEVEVKVDRQDRKMAQLSDFLERAPAAIGEQQRRELEAINVQLHQARAQLSAQAADLSSMSPGFHAMDSLEDSIVQLLRKVNISGGDVNSTPHRGAAQSSAFRDRQKAFGTSTPGRQTNNTSQNQRYSNMGNSGGSGGGMNNARITSVRGQGFNNSPARGSPARQQKPNSGGVNKTSPQVSPRPSAGAHTLNRARPSSGPGQRTVVSNNSSIPVAHAPRPKAQHQTSVTEGQTTVLYHTPHIEKPSTCLIHKKLGEIRLRDFKSAVGDSNLYHYYFKAYDPEYGQVKEEVFQDDDILPGFEGKIVAWLEEEGGTTV